MILSKIIERHPPRSTQGIEKHLTKNFRGITHRQEWLDPESLYVDFRKNELSIPDFVTLCKKAEDRSGPLLVYPELESVSQQMSIELHSQAIQEMEFIAVTGTNGKSTVVEFCRQLLVHLMPHKKPVSLGTLGLTGEEWKSQTFNTTPYPLDLFNHVQEAYDKGSRIMVLEASSHGLEQNRLQGLKFQTSAFTNITHDHLDYHKNFKAYVKAKKRLLELTGQTLVINNDDENLSGFEAPLQFIRYGLNNPGSDLSVEGLVYDEKGIRGCFHSAEGLKTSFYSPLLGTHNVSNILCALGIMKSLGCELKDVVPLIETLKAPRGRLEPVTHKGKGSLIIDYAHTPDALEHALKSLRRHFPKSRLKVLFGCGGDRDAEKRPIMGKVASQHADAIVLTSDNPRYEDPMKILGDIQRGVSAGVQVDVEEDRVKAIEQTVSRLEADEVLLIAGKGHETTQERGGQKIHMDEVEICHNL